MEVEPDLKHRICSRLVLLKRFAGGLLTEYLGYSESSLNMIF